MLHGAGIFTYMWVIFWVNVGSLFQHHGASGNWWQLTFCAFLWSHRWWMTKAFFYVTCGILDSWQDEKMFDVLHPALHRVWLAKGVFVLCFHVFLSLDHVPDFFSYHLRYNIQIWDHVSLVHIWFTFIVFTFGLSRWSNLFVKIGRQCPRNQTYVCASCASCASLRISRPGLVQHDRDISLISYFMALISSYIPHIFFPYIYISHVISHHMPIYI
jgi:hypothetical protein